MGLRFTMPIAQWINSLGSPLAGGKAYFYATGTATPLTTYSDNARTVENTNPVVADSTGTFGPIFLQALDYKVNLTTSTGVVVPGFPVDPVHGATDAGDVTYLQGWTGAISRTVASRMGEILSAKDFGAVGDGTTDDTTALQNWLTALGTGSYSTTIVGPGIGFLPAGKYKHTVGLTIPAQAVVFGVPSKSTFLPSSAVTPAAIVQGIGSTLEGVVIDGVNTTSKLGLSIGTSALVNSISNNGITRKVQCVRFAGTTGYALDVKTGVIWTFEDSYFGDSTYGANIIDSGAGTPTTLNFTRCLFKGNTRRGKSQATGQECQFTACIFENNGEEGSYDNIASGGGGAVLWNTQYIACYWESNQTNLASGAARHAAYHAYSRGTKPKFRDCFWSHASDGSAFTSEARALQLDNAVDFVVDHCDVANEAGQISVISSSTGTFVNWPEGLGSIDTVVADSTSFGSVSLLYGKHGTWTPVATFSTPGDLAVGYAANGQQGRFSRQENRYTLQGFLDISTFTFTTASGNFRVTGLPQTPKTVTGFEWTGSCGSFQGVTKANYTTIAPKISSANNYIEFDISGSAQTLATLGAADMPTGTAKKFKFTITYEI